MLEVEGIDVVVKGDRAAQGARVVQRALDDVSESSVKTGQAVDALGRTYN